MKTPLSNWRITHTCSAKHRQIEPRCAIESAHFTHRCDVEMCCCVHWCSRNGFYDFWWSLEDILSYKELKSECVWRCVFFFHPEEETFGRGASKYPNTLRRQTYLVLSEVMLTNEEPSAAFHSVPSKISSLLVEEQTVRRKKAEWRSAAQPDAQSSYLSAAAPRLFFQVTCRRRRLLCVSAGGVWTRSVSFSIFKVSSLLLRDATRGWRSATPTCSLLSAAHFAFQRLSEEQRVQSSFSSVSFLQSFTGHYGLMTESTPTMNDARVAFVSHNYKKHWHVRFQVGSLFKCLLNLHKIHSPYLHHTFNSMKLNVLMFFFFNHKHHKQSSSSRKQRKQWRFLFTLSGSFTRIHCGALNFTDTLSISAVQTQILFQCSLHLTL